jgi:dTDP-4-dehydrorhamnose 3,5-epimerase
MKFTPTAIPEVLLIEPQVFQDERGFFLESYQAKKFAASGIPHTFVQDNHSASHQDVLRGLHYQIRQPQGKLLRVVVGEIFDVAVDLRRASSTFGKWAGVTLSAQNKHLFWVPPGFAHGFLVLSEWAEVLYKATDFYAPQWERTLRWDDPTVEIPWPLVAGRTPILSVKDAAGKLLPEAEIFE